MSKTCNKCKAANPDNAHYCSTCGTALENRHIVVQKDIYDYYRNRVTVLERENQTLRNNNAALRRQMENSLARKIKSVWKAFQGADTVGETIMAIIGLIIMIVGGGYAIVGLCIWIASWFTSSKTGIEIVEKGGRYGLYNHDTDKQLIDCDYDSIVHHTTLGANFYALHRSGRIGIANGRGIKTVDCTLDSINILRYGLVHTFGYGKQGLASYTGEPILACNYYRVLWDARPRYQWWSTTEAGDFVGHIIPVRVNAGTGWTLVNRRGQNIGTSTYTSAKQNGDPGLITVERYGKYGVIDTLGKVIVPFEYTNYSISIFNNNRAWLRNTRSGIWTCIDNTGRQLFTLPRGAYPRMYNDSLCAVLSYSSRDYGMIEYYDVNGRIAIPKKYKQSNRFSPEFINGEAKVMYNNQLGKINKKGEFTAIQQ